MENYTEIKEQLTRIENALVGDSFGNKGIVKRLIEVENTQDLHADTMVNLNTKISEMNTKRRLSNLKLTGIIATSAAGSHGLWETIKYFFNK